MAVLFFFFSVFLCGHKDLKGLATALHFEPQNLSIVEHKLQEENYITPFLILHLATEIPTLNANKACQKFTKIKQSRGQIHVFVNTICFMKKIFPCAYPRS